MQARLAAPLTQLLALMHGAGLVHRGLEPRHIMLAWLGELKVVDFEYVTCHLFERLFARVGNPYYLGEWLARRGVRVVLCERTWIA